ncbi:copper chaperone PCu(A)C [Brevundimonas aveniformis]|uniref:copper chaperone PCu(A)C n=1 Tax=Brevundimonas aveniformis TaxID=370977 RepID=UPI00048E9854|nr:copper chaperone PCu(A)C [Brevundimonas aveniformis]
MRPLALLALPLLLAACQSENRTAASSETTVDGQTVAEVQVTDPWCRPTPNGMTMTACYVTLTSSTGDRLSSIISPRAAQSTVHAVSTEGGVMSMSEMPDGLALPTGQTVSLAPGGDHIMLTGVTVPLAEGDLVPLALTFESGAQIALEAPVRASPPGEDANPARH